MSSREQNGRPISVCFLISSLEYGGAERQVVEMVNTFDRKRVDPAICSLSREIPLSECLAGGGADIHIVERRGRFDISPVFRVAKYLRNNKFDVVHAFLNDAEIVARLAAPLAGRPLVVASERNTGYVTPLVPGLALRATSGLFDVMIANSNAGKQFNIRTKGVAESRIEVVHNGVDVERFRPEADAGKAFRDQAGIASDTPVVGMVGNFKRQKGHEFFVKMAAKIRDVFPDARFLIAGGGITHANSDSEQYQTEIRQLVSTLQLDNHLGILGTCDDMTSFYNACNVTALLSRHEGTPNAVLESMACGVPVIATNVSDNASIIEDGVTGHIVAPEDFETGAQKAVELLENPERLIQMGKASRSRANDEFSLTRAAEKLEAIYRDWLGRRSAQAHR